MIVCALAFFMLLLPGPVKIIAIAMIILITIGEISSMPFMNSFWSLRSDDKNRGQYAALFTMAWGIAQTFGPFLSSLLVDATSFTVLYIVVGGLLLIASFGFFRLSKLS